MMMAVLLKCLLAAAALPMILMVLADPSSVPRTGGRLFRLSKSTTTVVTYLTTVPVCSFTTSCATTTGPVTRCRRLRRQVLDVDLLFPTKPDRWISCADLVTPCNMLISPLFVLLSLCFPPSEWK